MNDIVRAFVLILDNVRTTFLETHEDKSVAGDINPEVKATLPAQSPSVSRTMQPDAVLFGVDGRSMEARRFKALIEEISNDLGGVDKLSALQRGLVRRAAKLSAHCDKMEADDALGKPFDIETYGIITDRLGRVSDRLGLARVARKVNLRQYLDAKADAK